MFARELKGREGAWMQYSWILCNFFPSNAPWLPPYRLCLSRYLLQAILFVSFNSWKAKFETLECKYTVLTAKVLTKHINCQLFIAAYMPLTRWVHSTTGLVYNPFEVRMTRIYPCKFLSRNGNEKTESRILYTFHSGFKATKLCPGIRTSLSEAFMMKNLLKRQSILHLKRIFKTVLGC